VYGYAFHKINMVPVQLQVIQYCVGFFLTDINAANIDFSGRRKNGVTNRKIPIELYVGV
tara:strand:+ start:654 stop:830 length:177 start_codon:yes stop_codon:yes gene_type:complete